MKRNSIHLLAAALGLAGLCSAADAGAQPSEPANPAGADTAEPAPALVPPELTRFVEAPYPPSAKSQGLTGQVILQIDIDGDGNVIAVEVNAPAGHGFDEAAADAARRFVFKPAMREGKSVPSRILYAYKFEMKEPPPPAPDRAPPPPPPATLSGVVRLAQGDMPMPGARIVVTAASGASQEVVADGEGRFAVPNLASGAYQLTLSAEGFQSLTVEEKIASGESLEVVYRLSTEGRPAGSHGARSPSGP